MKIIITSDRTKKKNPDDHRHGSQKMATKLTKKNRIKSGEKNFGNGKKTSGGNIKEF